MESTSVAAKFDDTTALVGMGLFDRLLKKDSQEADSTLKPRKPAKDKPEEFFLDADSSSSLGDVNYMRESKTIRRTFPGHCGQPRDEGTDHGSGCGNRETREAKRGAWW